MSYTRTYTNLNNINNNNNINLNDSIICAIATDKINDLKRYVNKENVNKIIDTKNRFTALHYAIQMRNEQMIKYLLSLDAEPKIKNGNGQDAFDMSLTFQMRTVIDCELAEKESDIKTHQQTINSITSKLSVTEKNVEYLQSTINKSNTEMRIVKNETEQLRNTLSNNKLRIADLEFTNSQYKSRCDKLTVENTDMKRKLDKLQTDYSVLESGNNILRKEFKEQEIIIDNLLKANKKNKI